MFTNDISDSLLCTEALDISALTKTPERQTPSQRDYTVPRDSYPELPPTVKAVQDASQVKDDRILQNLLRNEDKYLPCMPDYMSSVQLQHQGGITPAMRKIVAEWMLEVVHEQNSQPEVFYLAMNIMDRFLAQCRIAKSQLQLLGSVCILVSSKIREPCPIPGKTLIIYTDHSITAEEIREWELLVLYKLQWELTAITPMDYLDQTLPRLDLGLSSADQDQLRRRTETILVLLATEYRFAYHSPSLLAATAILTAVHSLSCYPEAVLREIKLRLQTVTHTATDHIDRCIPDILAFLPGYLKEPQQPSAAMSALPDSTTAAPPSTQSSPDQRPPSVSSPPPPQCSSPTLHDEATPTKVNSTTPPPSLVSSSPDPDLACKELLDDVISEGSEHDPTDGLLCLDSRSSSPLSAVDIFTEFNTNVLQAVFDQADGSLNSHFSNIMCS